MKLLFTADIHIKLGQKNVPVEWARNRYRLFNERLRTLQDDVDMVIIGGDVFDRVPTLDEIEVYANLIDVFTKPTYIISGNHESVKKNTTFLTNLKGFTARANKHVVIIDDFATIEGIDFMPYNKLKEYHPADVDFHSRILVTHVRGEIPPHVKPEVPLEMFDRWDVVLAGDLHSYENSQRNILYPGSPMSTSFHRNPVDNGVIIFDTESMTHSWISLELPQLIRKSITAGEPMPATNFDHTIYEVSGDLSDLGSVANSELLDKKISTRETDVALILDPGMTLSEELREYLEYILCLSEDNIKDALDLFKALEAQISD
jgi:DNA repair exonuclease SbcCD nuclease subunit